MPPVAKTKGKNRSGPQQAQEAPPKPAWPPIREPQQFLELHHLLPGQIVTIENFWTSKQCREYVSFLKTLPLTTTPGQPRRGEAVRVNDRLQIHDAAFAEMLWSNTHLKDLILGADLTSAVIEDGSTSRAIEKMWGGASVLGLNDNIRIYRYSKGQFFDQHYDDSNLIEYQKSIAARTTWTLLLYLTSSAEGCRGGETVFYPESSSSTGKKGKKGLEEETTGPIVVELQTGMALLHRHGAECMVHEGREVLEGEKWVIRSDLCVKR